MNNETKRAIQDLIGEAITAYGGQRAVASKAKVSAATISQIQNDKWDLISDEMWMKIGAALGYADTSWKVVDTIFNMRVIETTFRDAKENSMMMAVSHKAGSGKTAGCKVFLQKYRGKQVHYIHCREWSLKTFLLELCVALGIEAPRSLTTGDQLMQIVIEYFNVRANKRPLLIVDEADKLKPSALRSFISLFNATEDRLGIVLIGTENLSAEIKRGVKHNKKGFDEIDSRLGRQYVRLYGAVKKDVAAICAANGVTNKKTQAAIWKECAPKEVQVGETFVTMVDDLRRLKRVIQRENIKVAVNGQ